MIIIIMLSKNLNSLVVRNETKTTNAWRESAWKTTINKTNFYRKANSKVMMSKLLTNEVKYFHFGVCYNKLLHSQSCFLIQRFI